MTEKSAVGKSTSEAYGNTSEVQLFHFFSSIVRPSSSDEMKSISRCFSSLPYHKRILVKDGQRERNDRHLSIRECGCNVQIDEGSQILRSFRISSHGLLSFCQNGQEINTETPFNSQEQKLSASSLVMFYGRPNDQLLTVLVIPIRNIRFDIQYHNYHNS
jgi:hypothetical protein